jgi:hypothetical protein
MSWKFNFILISIIKYIKMSMMHNNNNSSQSKTLWLGDVDPWMNEDFIKSIFRDYGNKNIK